jgi:hypothetical protein
LTGGRIGIKKAENLRKFSQFFAWDPTCWRSKPSKALS